MGALKEIFYNKVVKPVFADTIRKEVVTAEVKATILEANRALEAKGADEEELFQSDCGRFVGRYVIAFPNLTANNQNPIFGKLIHLYRRSDFDISDGRGLFGAVIEVVPLTTDQEAVKIVRSTQYRLLTIESLNAFTNLFPTEREALCEPRLQKSEAVSVFEYSGRDSIVEAIIKRPVLLKAIQENHILVYGVSLRVELRQIKSDGESIKLYSVDCHPVDISFLFSQLDRLKRKHPDIDGKSRFFFDIVQN